MAVSGIASGRRLSKGPTHCWTARIPRQHLKYFVQSGQFPRHSRRARSGGCGCRKGALVIQKLGQHARALGVAKTTQTI